MTTPTNSPKDQQLRELADASRTRRLLGGTVPWVVSLTLHLVVVLLGLTVVWSVTYIRAQQSEPVAARPEPPAPATFLPPVLNLDDASLVELEPIELQTTVQPTTLDEPAPQPLLLSAGDLQTADLSGRRGSDAAGTARFAGLSTNQANRICYVLDASGSMRLRLPIVINELMRSIDHLGEDQRFMVVLFQNDRALVPDFVDRRLTPLSPTRENKDALARWLDTVVARGRSNPIAALETAAKLQPDTLFLLSNNITGAGQYEISQAILLSKLDELNPLDRRRGRRPMVIATVQFIDPDPLDTLRIIAERHGVGEESYNFIGRGEVEIQ